MPVLVLDGRSRAAIETVQSLGRAGLEIDLAAESLACPAMRSHYVRRKLHQPADPSSSSFQSWLRQQDLQHKYELIVPSTEVSLLALRLLDEGDSLRTRAVIPGNEAIDIALDKNKTWQLGHELGVPTPQSVLLPSEASFALPASYPVVLKPLHSKINVYGKLKTIDAQIIRDEDAYKRYVERWMPHTPLVQQQYISGSGVGANFLFDRGRKVWQFLHERVHEYPLSGGASSYRRSIPPMPALVADAEKILTFLNWHGVAMVEFKMDAAGRHWLIEINPRLWGSLALAIDAGVNFPLGLWLLAKKLEVPPQPAYRTYYYTRDLKTDMGWMKANLFADRKDPLLLTKPRLTSALEVFRPFIGRESWDHFDFRDLAVTRAVLAETVGQQLRKLDRKVRHGIEKFQVKRHHHALLQRRARSGSVNELLFLCTGNICRSPFAEKLGQNTLPGITIHSRGSHELSGRECPAQMQRAACSFGVDLSECRSKTITPKEIVAAELILVMDFVNLHWIKRHFPEALPRTTLLGLFAQPPILAIEDPYLGDAQQAQKICEQISIAVTGLASYLKNIQRQPLESRVTLTEPSGGGR